MTWDEAYALTIDGAVRSASYGRPAVKASGRTLTETKPGIYWEMSHHAGYAATLVREEAIADGGTCATIDRAHAQALMTRRRRR